MQLKQLKKATSISLIGCVILYVILFFMADKSIDVWMHNYFLPYNLLYRLCIVLAIIFKPVHWFILAIVICIASFFCPEKPGVKMLFWGLAMITAFIIAFILKVLLARYRPDLLFSQNLYGFHGFSLKHDFNSTPSGHAVMAFAGFYGLARLTDKRWLRIFCVFFAVVIALSRIIITAHFLSDVLLGAYIGIVTVLWLEYFLFRKQTELS